MDGLNCVVRVAGVCFLKGHGREKRMITNEAGEVAKVTRAADEISAYAPVKAKLG